MARVRFGLGPLLVGVAIVAAALLVLRGMLVYREMALALSVCAVATVVLIMSLTALSAVLRIIGLCYAPPAATPVHSPERG
jgi:hypothetical protein